MSADSGSLKAFKRYPPGNVAFCNGVTLAHYGLGAAGIILGYACWPTMGIV